jgi:hypothetical protein
VLPWQRGACVERRTQLADAATELLERGISPSTSGMASMTDLCSGGFIVPGRRILSTAPRIGYQCRAGITAATVMRRVTGT